MGKKHFTEEQIAFVLRQQESGTPVAELPQFSLQGSSPSPDKFIQIRVHRSSKEPESGQCDQSDKLS